MTTHYIKELQAQAVLSWAQAVFDANPAGATLTTKTLVDLSKERAKFILSEPCSDDKVDTNG